MSRVIMVSESNQKMTTIAGDIFSNAIVQRHGGFGVVGLFGEEKSLIFPWSALVEINEQARREGMTFGEKFVSMILEKVGMPEQERHYYMTYARKRGHGITKTGMMQYIGSSDE